MPPTAHGMNTVSGMIVGRRSGTRLSHREIGFSPDSREPVIMPHHEESAGTLEAMVE